MQHRLDTFLPADSSLSSPVSPAEDERLVPKISTKLMVVLTCGIGGLQLIWSTIFSHGSAYLFSLGITESQSSLIWAIAPICGTVVQPIIGTLADNSRSRWGRRRPFILGGTIGIVACLIALAWIGDIVRGLATTFGISSDEGVKTTTQVGIIVCITLLNLSIQPVQLGLRALIIDACPSEQQSIASAWAGRFSSTSNIVGYMFGSVPLGSILRDSEVGRFRFLSLLSLTVLVATVSITAYYIREEDPRESIYNPQGRTSLLGAIRDVRNGWSEMNLQSRRVCCVQFFAWLGWFGFLFYSTSYVGRLYLVEARGRDPEHIDLLKDAGTRLGTFATLLSAIAALVTTVIAPYVASSVPTTSSFDMLTTGSSSRWRQTHIIWALSHLLYAFCNFFTIFITSTNTAILIVALTGVSWGVTQWAPFALLGEDVAIRSNPMRRGQQWKSNHAGTMMGVHNAAISVPQTIAALSSAFVLWIFEEERSGTDDGIAWVLRLSGTAALAAAYYAWRLK